MQNLRMKMFVSISFTLIIISMISCYGTRSIPLFSKSERTLFCAAIYQAVVPAPSVVASEGFRS